MRTCWLTRAITITTLALAGCGESAAAPAPEPLEIEGGWLYLGPSDAPHTLTIAKTSMAYADVDGKWSSTWTIRAHDNGLNHFQVAFDSGSGAYLPLGQSMSGAYDVSGTLLTVQLANSNVYPQLQSPGTCTAALDGAPVPDCRLYIKQ
jgi:hypothetical protein